MSTELVELSNALAQATDRAAASTVAVHTEARGSSSGVVWSSGMIVTAEHALRRDEEIHVTLPDGRAVAATLKGRDPSTDIAVLQCKEATKGVAEFGDVPSLKPGSLTLVVGRTRASGPVAALGVVSLVAAERHTWTGASLAPYVRLDIGLQPTAAGGAVIDAHGAVIGIATARFTRFGAIAIPAPAINKVADILMRSGRIPRAYLGLGLQRVRLPDTVRQSLQNEQSTAVIALEVEPDGPANRAGILIGDILVSLDGRAVTGLEDVQSLLHSGAIGRPVATKFVRAGVVQEKTIVVGERQHGAE
jgi:S1-C subfamily serine protease